MSSTYDSRKTINAHHFLCGEPFVLNQFTKEHKGVILHLCHLALGMRGISLQSVSPWLGKDSAVNTPSLSSTR